MLIHNCHKVVGFCDAEYVQSAGNASDICEPLEFLIANAQEMLVHGNGYGVTELGRPSMSGVMLATSASPWGFLSQTLRRCVMELRKSGYVRGVAGHHGHTCAPQKHLIQKAQDMLTHETGDDAMELCEAEHVQGVAGGIREPLGCLSKTRRKAHPQVRARRDGAPMSLNTIQAARDTARG